MNPPAALPIATLIRPSMPSNPSKSPPRFVLAVTAEVGKAYLPYLRRHLRAAHKRLGPAPRELSLALVADKRMSELHQRFMGVPGPTDVLTFPLEADGRGRVVSGEVVVCVPEARRRARAEGTTVEKELLLYALHGLLHLCGFDDTTGAGFATMHRTEDKILTAIGVGPVFAAGHSTGRSTGRDLVGAAGGRRTRGRAAREPPPAAASRAARSPSGAA